MLRSLCLSWAVWLFTGLAVAQTGVSKVPDPRSHGGWISDATKQLGEATPELEALLAALNRDTKAEVAVAIVPSIGKDTPREFATALFKHWGIGRREHDNGLLVLHVLDQRRIEIETGYGLESALTDVECSWLINDVATPLFRADKIAEGHAAMLRGIDHGIRHPEATREQLLAATRMGGVPLSAAGANDGESTQSNAPEFGDYLEQVGPWLIFAALFAGLAAGLRKLAHRSQYRNPKRRPEEFSGCLVSVLFACGWIFLAAAWLTEHAWVAWWGVVCLVVFAGFLVVGAWRAFAEGRRRYAPRTCSACNARMELVDDDKDDRYLEEGQRAEERVRSADYFVWRCRCGARQIDRHKDEGHAEACTNCGYQTRELKRVNEIKPATHIAEGLAERHYVCAHCKVQQVVKVVLPRIEVGSSGGGSSSRSSSSGSSSSGSSSRGGSSFGGGRSGGGGAGGSY